MATQSQRIVTFILVFLLGIVTGSGLGYLYGRDTADTELQRELSETQERFETVNQNYLILVREYNKLFKLNAPAVQTVAAVPPVESETYQVPASGEETAEPETPEEEAPPATEESTAESEEAADASAEPTEEGAAAEEESASGEAGPEADFEAESIGGTGPLEGPPPQPFRFTDLSTGEIESWEWEFGDGETSTEQNPEHTYRRCPNDLCTVKLTVCGPGGCDTEVKEDYLWVSESCSGC